MQKVKAVILVGGPGTRLRPLTIDRPKSVVPVINRPVMEHVFAYLRHYGIEDIILTMNYLPVNSGAGERIFPRRGAPSARARRQISTLFELERCVIEHAAARRA